MSQDVTELLFTVSDPEHPHYLESGYLTGEVINVLGELMAKFKLDHCKHGTEACFVKHGQLRQEYLPGAKLPKRGQTGQER